MSNGGLGGWSVLDHMREVEGISSSSKNLKGTFVRALRVAARETSVAVTELIQRSSDSGEARWLANENAQLKAELRSLKKEMQELRKQQRKGPAGSRESAAQVMAPPVESSDGAAGAPRVPTKGVRGESRMQRAKQQPGLLPTCAPPLSTEPRRKDAVLEVERIQEGTIQERVIALMRREMAGLERRLLSACGAISQQERGERQARTFAEVAAAKAPVARLEARGAAQLRPADTAPKEKAGDVWRVARSKAARKKTRRKERREEGMSRKSVIPTSSRKVTEERCARQLQSELLGRAAGHRRKETVLQRPPRTAAVAITATPGARLTYAQAMTVARAKISLAELGIEGVRPKTSRTGGLLLEIRGPDSHQKAQNLAVKMAGVLEGTGVRIWRPSKTAELRVKGLDASVRPSEVSAAIAAVGECSEVDIKVGDIAVGPSGRGAAWVRCPVSAAHRVAGKRWLTVGWCRATVEPLQARPLQCFRCLELGHARSGCTSAVDRSSRCYRCGDSGHRANKCSAAPRCPVCSDIGRPAGHRLGAPSCAPRPSVRGGRRPTVDATTRTAPVSAGTSAAIFGGSGGVLERQAVTPAQEDRG